MTISKSEIEELVRLVALTKDGEIDCAQCLELVAEFADQELAGKSLSDGLKAVEHHLQICADCREEYQLLRQALSAMDR